MRKNISKKTRFEVFKRDSFKCQYCGESAPDTILHVDHIFPVSLGGDNSILNLITSCKNCNLGKSDRKLSDSSEVQKQKNQLDELNEKRNQLNLMNEWRKELFEIEEEKVQIIQESWAKASNGYHLNDFGIKSCKKILKKFSLEIILNSIETSIEQYSDGSKESLEKAWDYVGRICTIKKREIDNPVESEFYYIRGILKNRFYSWYENLNYQAIDVLKKAHKQGLGIENLKIIAKKSKNWTHFKNLINEAIEGL